MKIRRTVLIMLAFGLTACGEKTDAKRSASKNPSPQTMAPPQAMTSLQGAGSSSVVPTVKLLDAGAAEGRSTLRYKLKAGQSEPMVMRMKMDMDMKMPGMGSQKVEMPVIVMRMTTRVTAIGPDGTAKLAFSIDKADTEKGGNPLVESELKKLLGKFAGIKGSYSITPRGITSDTKVELAGATDPQIQKTMEQMRQSMEQASSPLPVEPVGVGARWEVRQLVEAEGMKVRQSVEYKLEARDGDELNLVTILRQDADKQTISLPEMQGASAQLDSYDAKGSGALKTRLTSLVPTGHMKLKNHIKMTVQGNALEMGLDMKVDIGTK